MGGLAFEDTAPDELHFMPYGLQRMVLPAAGVEILADRRPSLIPDFSRDFIADKSKSDGLAKLLTLWQATFFCIQCAVRISQGLSISLLEINVFAHAICALWLFVLWWDKPRDVQQPILLVDTDALDVCAWLCVVAPCKICTRNYTYQPANVQADCRVPHPNKDFRIDFSKGSTTFGLSQQPCLKVHDTYWNCRKASSSRDGACWGILSEREMRWLARAYKNAVAWGTETTLTFSALTRSTNWHVDLWNVVPHMFATGTLEDVRCQEFWRPITGFTLAGWCYGGLHVLGWTVLFPSRTETLLWRAACATILLAGPTGAIFSVAQAAISSAMRCVQKSASDWWDPVSYKFSDRYLFVLTYILIPVFFRWYILCRAFLVVECFIMLAHIPDTALHVPTWAAYVPHIT
ncbi:hypothetical protein LTR95_010179 [Oleoguttula sp. CCFEE 5521]